MVATGVALVFTAAAFAARTFPQNSRQVRITTVTDDAIVANGKTLHTAPGLLVFTSNNTTLVRGALPANIIARVQVDPNGDVQRIWLLADDEVLQRPWWQLWGDQPQGQPNDAVRVFPAD